MPNLVPTILPKLEAHRLPGLDTGPRTIHPYFGPEDERVELEIPLFGMVI